MTNQINLKDTVFQICKQNPEIKALLIELGFKPLDNPLMFNTVARATTLLQGCKIIGLDRAQLIQQLEWNGYEVIGGHTNE